MKQIISLEKEIAFKTMIGEITSISLEHDLSFINDSEVEGNLIISGTYKMTEASTLEESFNYRVPVEFMLTNSLVPEKRNIDINNFTYEIVNDEALFINVEILIEGLEKIEINDIENEDDKEDNKDIEDESKKKVLEEEKGKEEVRNDDAKENIEVLTTDVKDDLPSIDTIEKNENITSQEEKVVDKITETKKDEDVSSNQNNNKVMDSIFSAFANTNETYSTYSVYILREDDNLEEVIRKYKTTREELSEYNDLDNLKIGTKLIIPTTIEDDE